MSDQVEEALFYILIFYTFMVAVSVFKLAVTVIIELLKWVYEIILSPENDHER